MCQQPTEEKRVNSADASPLLIPQSEQQGEKGSARPVKQTMPLPGKRESLEGKSQWQKVSEVLTEMNQAGFKMELSPENDHLTMRRGVTAEIPLEGLSSLSFCL